MPDKLKEQFMQPSDDYTPVPFWFWNGSLEFDELYRQIDEFQNKGIAGFVIHPRLGLSESIPYLSDRYMDFVEFAVVEACRRKMQVYLYDEAMYPSGSAMGKVVLENQEYASRGLKKVEVARTGTMKIPVVLQEGERLVSAQAVCRDEAGRVLLERSIILNSAEGYVAFDPPDSERWSIVFFIDTFSKGVIRGVHFGQDDSDPGAPASTDLLNREATETFIRITHETYYRRLRSYFGHVIKGFFTDEPNIMGRRSLPGLQPWTAQFLEDFRLQGLEEIHLPALWLDAGLQTERIRQQYRKAVNQRMARSYYQPLSEWCARHGIVLTGHPSASDDIGFLEYFQLPGQDVVWRYVEPIDGKMIDGADSTLAKCASDAARHRGRHRNVVECFGACGKDGIGWNFSADDMKWYMDWLFVRGTNMLMPHAFYYSLEGKRKHERPPDVGLHNIWWPHYRMMSDYMKRMSWLMTGGVNQTKIAVLCQDDHLPWKIVKPLYEHQIEFNYLEETLWTSTVTIEQGTAHIEQQRYDVILIERTDDFGQDTIKKLQQFIEQGGKVIVSQDAPISSVVLGARTLTSSEEIITIIDSYMERDLIITPANSKIRVTHICKEDVHFYFIVNEGEEKYEGTVQLGIKGKVEKWSPWEAVMSEQKSCTINANSFELQLERRESIVFCVDPSVASATTEKRSPDPVEERFILLDSWMTAGFDQSVPYPTLLTSWTEWPNGVHYSGTVEYYSSFEITEWDDVTQISLDLGEVHELATVLLNGVDLGVTMWKPYRYESIHHAVKVGRNDIRIRISNSLANKYDQVSLPSGLLGPVTIKLVSAINS